MSRLDENESSIPNFSTVFGATVSDTRQDHFLAFEGQITTLQHFYEISCNTHSKFPCLFVVTGEYQSICYCTTFGRDAMVLQHPEGDISSQGAKPRGMK